MHTIAANSYVAYRSLRGRLANTIWPPELDPLSALIVRFLWVNGSTMVVDDMRAQLAIPRSTLSSALRRREARGYIRRRSNPVDARYVVVSLTRAGTTIAPAVTDVISTLEADVRDAAGDDAAGGFDRVATMLASMDEEEG
jgi:DNA-binding MarR family transcriptional regulator